MGDTESLQKNVSNLVEGLNVGSNYPADYMYYPLRGSDRFPVTVKIDGDDQPYALWAKRTAEGEGFSHAVLVSERQLPEIYKTRPGAEIGTADSKNKAEAEGFLRSEIHDSISQLKAVKGGNLPPAFTMSRDDVAGVTNVSFEAGLQGVQNTLEPSPIRSRIKTEAPQQPSTSNAPVNLVYTPQPQTPQFNERVKATYIDTLSENIENTTNPIDVNRETSNAIRYLSRLTKDSDTFRSEADRAIATLSEHGWVAQAKVLSTYAENPSIQAQSDAGQALMELTDATLATNRVQYNVDTQNVEVERQTVPRDVNADGVPPEAREAMCEAAEKMTPEQKGSIPPAIKTMCGL